jgi:hypothetical protein
MWTFVVHRLVRAVFVCLGISLITFMTGRSGCNTPRSCEPL